MRTLLFIFSLPVFLFLFVGSAFGQPKSLPDYKFQSLYLYNFTKYISWPAMSTNEPIRIGILADSLVFDEISQFLSDKKSANGQPISLIHLKTPKNISNEHIVFLSDKSKFELKQVSKKIADKPILLVSEQPDGIKKGSIIDIIRKDGSLKIQINKKQADRAKLKIDDQLIKICVA